MGSVEGSNAMTTLARYRKTLVSAVGFAVTLAVLVPTDQVPEAWRPWVALVLAAGTVAGVRQVPNAPPKTGVILSETSYERPPPPEPPPPPVPRYRPRE
jgi:hypothetical protein